MDQCLVSNTLLSTMLTTTWMIMCSMIANHLYFYGVPWIVKEKEIKTVDKHYIVVEDTDSDDDTTEEQTQEESRSCSTSRSRNDSDDEEENQKELIDMMRQKASKQLINRFVSKFEAHGMDETHLLKNVLSNTLEQSQADAKTIQHLNSVFDDKGIDALIQLVITLGNKKTPSTPPSTPIDTLDQCMYDS